MAGQWILDLSEELQFASPEELYAKSIYRVPKILTDVNGEAYKPKLASFGPYHHNRRHLRQMEKHKHRTLIQFHRRIAKASRTPEDVLFAMRQVQHRLLASYDSLIIEDKGEDFCERGHFDQPDWSREEDKFLKLMIVDGCFALEVMLTETRLAAGEESEYKTFDPVFGAERKPYIIPDIKSDMLLLENQIPLLALTTLAAIDGSGIGDVRALIKAFYNLSSASLSSASLNDGLTDSFHILDLYRKITTAEGMYRPSYVELSQSATGLKKVGVSFCKSNTKSFKDISFNSNVLSLPPIEIDDTTESLLLNLMAFERLHATVGNEVTAYAFFMSWLINTEDDVVLLRTEGIMMGWLGCERNIANMFNNIRKGGILVVYEDDMQNDVNGRLNSYCKRRMYQLRVCFVKAYFKIIGSFILALTIVQTVYTVLQFHRA